MSAAEERVIGSVLRDPTIYGRVQLGPEHFDSPACRSAWVAMGICHSIGSLVDELTVADAMGPTQLEACGGLSWLAKVASNVSTTSNVEHHVGIIRDVYLAKEVKQAASAVVESGGTGEELLTQLSTASDALTASLSRPGRTLASVVGVELEAALGRSGEPLGLPTGLGIDRWIPGGYPLAKVVTLFADTGSFKTTAVNQIMFNLATEGYRGLLVPLEDSDELTAHRWMSRMSGVNYGRIAGGVLNDAERQKLGLLAPGDWAPLENIRSCDGIEPKIDAIIREVAAAKARGGLDYVVVDYIQLLEGYGNQLQILQDAMKKAANAAKRYNVCWIYLSQQNDKAKERKDPRPDLGDMFGSSSMKQQSKTVLSLFRPSEHWENPTGTNHPLWGMYAKLIERKGQRGMETYKNIVELWMVKNVLGHKKRMQILLAKPELGILDPIPGGADML